MLLDIFEILIDSLLLVPNTTAIAAYITVTGSLLRKQALYTVFAYMCKVNYGAEHMDDCHRDSVSPS